ncbi:hypothetical protein ACH5RR_029527 [Cinchona calisaya]|uniref:DUF4283 domain-containing protein n=1 Tax=Cinchona calisaya TaxID=153742 RepID=A0ABD2YRW9_9GENT
MDEDVVQKFQGFILNSWEQSGVVLDSSDTFDGRIECVMSLLGRVYTHKIANFNGLKAAMQIAWNFPVGYRVVELGPNSFQFFFSDKKGINKILSRRPWFFDNQFFYFETMAQWYG